MLRAMTGIVYLSHRGCKIACKVKHVSTIASSPIHKITMDNLSPVQKFSRNASVDNLARVLLFNQSLLVGVLTLIQIAAFVGKNLSVDIFG